MKKAIFMLFVISFMLIITDQKYVVIPEESIRFRVIPASNSVKDIFIKEEVTKDVLNIINKEEEDINSFRSNTINKIDLVEETINNVFKKYNYKEKYEINYGENYFPKKVFNEVVYPEGNYESMVIKIGKGEGSNFWCVLFPPLCMLENNSDTKDVTYKFKVKEIIDKVMNNI